MSAVTLDRRTYDVADAARLLGISLRTARDEIRRSGTLAGVPVIRAAPRRIVIPRDSLDRILSGDVLLSPECPDGGDTDAAA